MYVADSYLGGRVMVFDLNTFAFKRGWGAYGHRLSEISIDDADRAYTPGGPMPKEFRGHLTLNFSNDGLVYAADRNANRIHVTDQGRQVPEGIHRRADDGRRRRHRRRRVLTRQASRDFCSSRISRTITIWFLNREDGKIVGQMGSMGENGGQLYGLHMIAVDSKRLHLHGRSLRRRARAAVRARRQCERQTPRATVQGSIGHALDDERKTGRTNMIRRTVFLAALMAFALPAFAHHGGGTFDLSKSVTFQGKLTRLEFINPHSWLYFEVTDANGKVSKYRCEMRSAHTLRRSGWTQALFPIGQQVTIDAAPDRADPNSCYLNTIKFQNGSSMDRYGQYVKAGGKVQEVRGQVNTVDTSKRAARRLSGEPNISGDWAPEQVVMRDPRGTGGGLVPLSQIGDRPQPGERQGGARAAGAAPPATGAAALRQQREPLRQQREPLRQQRVAPSRRRAALNRAREAGAQVVAAAVVAAGAVGESN